jgi:hypothetical protein
MSRLIGVYGAAGCGSAILPLLRLQYLHAELVFIDDGQAPRQMNGHQVVTWGDFLEFQVDKKSICIAIAASKTRQILAEKCAASNIALIEA